MKGIILCLLVTSILVLFTTPAYAYLDPGTGSMILQGVIAAALVVAGTIGVYWRRLLSFFKKDDRNNEDE